MRPRRGQLQAVRLLNSFCRTRAAHARLLDTHVNRTSHTHPPTHPQSNDFWNADGLLGNTMKKLNVMMNTGGQKHMVYLIGFVVFVFFVLWFMIKAKA